MIFLLWAIFHLATAHEDHNKRQTDEEYFDTIQELVMKVTNLEKKIEFKDEQMGHLQKRVNELEKGMGMQCKADVKKELNEILPTAIQRGLRDLPFEMVCAFRYEWTEQAEYAVVTYDRITLGRYSKKQNE